MAEVTVVPGGIRELHVRTSVPTKDFFPYLTSTFSGILLNPSGPSSWRVPLASLYSPLPLTPVLLTTKPAMSVRVKQYLLVEISP